jgi:hypothetical protein
MSKAIGCPLIVVDIVEGSDPKVPVVVNWPITVPQALLFDVPINGIIDVTIGSPD